MWNPGEARSLVQLYRGGEGLDDLGSTSTTWTPGEQAWVEFPEVQGRLRNYGAGEQPAAGPRVRFNALADVRARDGFAVEAGPEVGTKWRVLAVSEPEGAERIAELEPFNGPFS